MVPSTFPAEKQALRRKARANRATLADPQFPLRLAQCAEDLGLAPGTIVGAYHAHQGEADPAELLARLVELDMAIAFPRVTARDTALDFHIVPAGEILMPGSFGIPEPLAHWPHATPQVLLVPLLAFDHRGHRLGTGGGFYDRTLAALNVPAFGIAYAGQEVPSLPAEPHDRTLDGILTEAGLRLFS
jgi:5-formyltetrahydrofolate cyclo-ligase